MSPNITPKEMAEALRQHRGRLVVTAHVRPDGDSLGSSLALYWILVALGKDPAVIMRVEKEGKILLARHVQRIPNLFTCLAGYVEVGESLEDAVRREVREEVGLEVADVPYAGSQHWPHPNQLMLAFRAQWAAGELRLQADELSEARWSDQTAATITSAACRPPGASSSPACSGTPRTLP